MSLCFVFETKILYEYSYSTSRRSAHRESEESWGYQGQNPKRFFFKLIIASHHIGWLQQPPFMMVNITKLPITLFSFTHRHYYMVLLSIFDPRKVMESGFNFC